MRHTGPAPVKDDAAWRAQKEVQGVTVHQFSTSPRTDLDLKGLFNTKEELRDWILTHTDQTNLEPTLTTVQLSKFVNESGEKGFRHICIPLTYVATARKMIDQKGFNMEIATVVGFPHGNELSTEDKVRQVTAAAHHGASEVDFVANISLFRSDLAAFSYELRTLMHAAKSNGMHIKMILETYYLSDSEISRMSEIGAFSWIDTVKTSTGFAVKGKNHPDRDPEEIGATVRAIELMGAGVSDKSKVGIKPAGGIRTLDKLLDILAACKAAGWDLDMVRMGTSAGIQFLDALQ